MDCQDSNRFHFLPFLAFLDSPRLLLLLRRPIFRVFFEDLDFPSRISVFFFSNFDFYPTWDLVDRPSSFFFAITTSGPGRIPTMAPINLLKLL